MLENPDDPFNNILKNLDIRPIFSKTHEMKFGHMDQISFKPIRGFWIFETKQPRNSETKKPRTQNQETKKPKTKKPLNQDIFTFK